MPALWKDSGFTGSLWLIPLNAVRSGLRLNLDKHQSLKLHDVQEKPSGIGQLMVIAPDIWGIIRLIMRSKELVSHA